MSSMGNERKLTPEQEDEIVREYVESRIDPEREPVRQVDLAKKYGVAQSTISNTINNSGVMERMRRRTKASVAIAQAMAEAAAPKVMRETVIDALKEREDQFGYLSQNARRDVLDRAGVRAAKEDKQEVTVSFASGMAIKPAMPEREDEADE